MLFYSCEIDVAIRSGYALAMELLEEHMEDLIYKFLIQSGYSRASIVTDVKSVDSSISNLDASLIVVDPENADRLACICVIGRVDADELHDQAVVAASTARRLGGKQVQGFVIRVDAQAKSEAEQVQFYRCYPNTDLQRLSARTFPDLDSLKVHHKLTAVKPAPTPEIVDTVEHENGFDSRVSRGAYVPAALLVFLGVLDWAIGQLYGFELFNTAQVLLFIAAATLFTIPSLLHYLRSNH